MTCKFVCLDMTIFLTGTFITVTKHLKLKSLALLHYVAYFYFYLRQNLIKKKKHSESQQNIGFQTQETTMFQSRRKRLYLKLLNSFHEFEKLSN